MKKIYLILVATCFLLISNQAKAQESVIGTYKKTLGSDEHYFIYTLNINPDHTFDFHSYEDFTKSKRINPGATIRVKKKYGRGTWQMDGKVVSFMTDESSVNSEYELDFGGSKARFDFKSPRDKSDRVIPTALKFFQSGIFWMGNINMLKQ